jgi:hypothetical protein
MKYLLLAVSLGITNISYSQKLEQTIKTELPCYNTTELFKTLREKYKELPLLTGKADDEANSTMSLWLNPVDNNWTIIATKKELSCVIGTGTDMKIIPVRKGTNV